MINYDLIDKNKNKILNFAVIILALIITWQIYRSANDQVAALVQQQNNELEKNKVAEDIVGLEKKAATYKKLLVKKDLGLIMGTISVIAKNTSIGIVSLKPYAEEALDSYTNTSFLIKLNAPSYHALGDFISKVENHSDIYSVSEINISSPASNPNVVGGNVNLVVSLKIDTISYL